MKIKENPKMINIRVNGGLPKSIQEIETEIKM